MGWRPSPSPKDPSANVDSVFGRTGAVVAQSGDYTAAQVTNAADKASAAAQNFATNTIDVGGSTNPQISFSQKGTIIQSPAGGFIQITANNAVYPSASGSGLGKSGNVWGIIFSQGNSTSAITSGTLPTVSPSSGVAFQTLTTRDTFLVVPVTFTPTAGAAATCKVELSPDNVTFSTLSTETVPAGTALDSFVQSVALQVPAGWRVKLTVTNATLGTGTYY